MALAISSMFRAMLLMALAIGCSSTASELFSINLLRFSQPVTLCIAADAPRGRRSAAAIASPVGQPRLWVPRRCARASPCTAPPGGPAAKSSWTSGGVRRVTFFYPMFRLRFCWFFPPLLHSQAKNTGPRNIPPRPPRPGLQRPRRQRRERRHGAGCRRLGPARALLRTRRGAADTPGPALPRPALPPRGFTPEVLELPAGVPTKKKARPRPARRVGPPAAPGARSRPP